MRLQKGLVMRPGHTFDLPTIDLPTSECAPSTANRFDAVVLVGHGSLRPSAGAAMLHLAEHAHALGIAPLVTAGFLNYSQPTFADALAHCLKSNANQVIVQPYFLVPGKFVREDLRRHVDAFQAAHPDLLIRIAEPFGDHPALAQLLLKRAQEAEYLVATPPISQGNHPRSLDNRARLRPLNSGHQTGMLIIAHGSPQPESNKPIYSVAKRVRASRRYAAVMVCYLDLNKPSIAKAIDSMLARGIRRIIAVPYFLQLGNHVLHDLPTIVEEARARHPASSITLAEHLAYDQLLIAAIADRVAEALDASP
jgi:sirohydrochlorin cobaltochelatase